MLAAHKAIMGKILINKFSLKMVERYFLEDLGGKNVSPLTIIGSKKTVRFNNLVEFIEYS
jgi:hypothetical protein